jgi:hypothetical protein
VVASTSHQSAPTYLVLREMRGVFELASRIAAGVLLLLRGPASRLKQLSTSDQVGGLLSYRLRAAD